MARKKHVEEAPAGAPEWIVTFSDMVSLLVTFFVMLMSFSTISTNDSMMIVEAFAMSRGGVIENPDGPDAIKPPRLDRMNAVHSLRGAPRPHSRPDEALAKNLEDMGQREDDEHVALDLTAITDGLRIAFDARASFAPGSTEVPPELARSLGELARIFAAYDHLVVVEGHTDGAFQPTPLHPTAEALAMARAEACARIMLDESALSPDSLQLAGLGDTRPIAPNDTAAERTLNRRVELRLVALSRSRAARLERERAERPQEQR
ncbi:MAG TPA: OmpA family protein [Planctomycetota bacterium]|nr:OmpA family protein [Planctomycetota bacterium]